MAALLFLVGGLFALSTALAQAPIENVQSGFAGTAAGDWANPGNVTGPSDDNCANMGAVDKSNLTSNFGFDIPLDATITGVVAFIKAGKNGEEVIGVQLASDATVIPPIMLGTQQDLVVSGTGAACANTIVTNVGTALTDWGLVSLAPATVNSASFGMVFTKLQTSAIKIDSVCMEINYETDEGPAVQDACFEETQGPNNTITVTKSLVGTPPATDWSFSGTGGIGPFTLDAAGSIQTFTNLADGDYTITETTQPGYTATAECFIGDVSVATGSNEVTVSVAGTQEASCNFTNIRTTSFTVNKTYDDATTDAVTINLSCASGTVTTNDLSASPGNPAVFEVTGFEGDPNCTATESGVPAGYTADNTDCVDVALVADGECTIANTLNDGSFTVNKTYDDANQTPVTINLSCASGTVTTNDLSASPGSPAVFEVTDFEGDPNCTATESAVPAGYTADNTDCADVALLADGACTIANTANTGTFTVRKLYTDDNEDPVSVTASCTAPATVTNNPQPASPLASAIFEVSQVTEGTTCTATEVVPAGYEADESDCQDGDPIDGGCAITNSPAGGRATFRVTKDFTDDNPMGVEVFISCNTGLPLDQSKVITEATHVEFVVGDFDPGEMDCDVFEAVPNGYSPTYEAGFGEVGNAIITDDAEGCHFDDVEGGDFTCHIVNTPDPVEVEIIKDWVFEGSSAMQGIDTRYDLTLFCDAEIVDGFPIGIGQEAPAGLNGPGCGLFLAQEAPQGIFFADWCKPFFGEVPDTFIAEVIPEWPDSHCFVLERVFDDAVEVDNGCLNIVVSAGNGASCTITNTVFFEGIPTLNQYGMALLALLMLGIGFVGFRRLA